jgi:hypothetical protein
MSPPIIELATALQHKYRKSELFLLQLIVHPAEFLALSRKTYKIQIFLIKLMHLE